MAAKRDPLCLLHRIVGSKDNANKAVLPEEKSIVKSRRFFNCNVFYLFNKDVQPKLY